MPTATLLSQLERLSKYFKYISTAGHYKADSSYVRVRTLVYSIRGNSSTAKGTSVLGWTALGFMYNMAEINCGDRRMQAARHQP